MAIQMMVRSNVEGKSVPEITYEGCVISLGEHNYYQDSDFYAIVWDPELKCTREVEYATTRAGCDGYHAWVDFDKEKYGKEYDYYQRKMQFHGEADSMFLLRSMSPIMGAYPDKGKRVEVCKGRKVPIGTQGIIFSVKDNPYDNNNQLIMIKTDDGKYLRTYMRNVVPALPTRKQLEKVWIEVVGEFDDKFEYIFNSKIEYYSKMSNIWKG